MPPSVVLPDAANGYALVDQSLSNGPMFLAVDGSGNLWVLLNNNTVTELWSGGSSGNPACIRCEEQQARSEAVMRPKKDRMTGLEKAMRIRNDIAISDSRRIVFRTETGKVSFLRLLSGTSQRFVRTFVLCFSAAVSLAFSGCGATSVKPDVGSITVTDINGVSQPAIKSLTVGGGTYLDVALANDKDLLGADWTVSCGSALPPGTPLPPGQTIDTSCGYFTPIHTASAPVPAYAKMRMAL